MTTDKAREILGRFCDLVKSGELPQKIAEVTFPPFEAPCSKWSINNRLMMAFQGTMDARGRKQWDAVGRAVADKRQGVYILAPLVFKKVETNDNGDLVESDACCGFRTIELYAVENTYGCPLDYQSLSVPQMPLLEVAKAWGVEVKASPFMGAIMGCYTHGSSRYITLASPEAKTFFHELSHASQDALGMLKDKPNKEWCELTAELSAMVLAELCDMTISEVNPGATYEYVCRYAKSSVPEVIARKVMSLVKDVGAIVDKIFSVVKPMEVCLNA
ncbi:MAG: hypothetical protein WC307_06420 [Candidatus Nanoarchaeia archaeon]|jgi:hypothetical protein